MSDYRIYTDSACDLSPKILEEWGVSCCSLTFRFEKEVGVYANNDMSAQDFYAKMKKGGIAKTAAVNSEEFKASFEKSLEDGYDVIYIGFSSGLSTTYNSARIAAEELSEKYPDRKIITVDSLCASAGLGLLVYLAVTKKREGLSISSLADYLRDNVKNLCHWFTVDDLVYLKRGGRINPATAFVGNLLGIKPVLHMDDEGHLINVSKVRGRRSAIAALADKYGELAICKESDLVFISEADCISDANTLSDMLRERYGARVQIITDVGPVIGAHSGPGTLALFFLGKAR